jgi:hypothetical protein
MDFELDLFSQLDNQNDDDIIPCSICYEPLESETTYRINECNHIFHSNCLLNWFRSSYDASCPNCRNIQENKINNNDNTILFDMKIKFSKTNKAPKDFIKLVKKYEELKKKYTSADKEYKQIWKEKLQFNKKIDENKSYKQIKKEKKELYSKANIIFKRRNTTRSKYFLLKNAIDMIPIKSIIIKTKKYNKK